MNDYADRHLPGEMAVPPLSQLNISLAGGISLGCQGCWVTRKSCDLAAGSTPENELPHTLALEIIFQAIHEALPLGLRRVRLTGRNTLLYPHFDALLDQLESLELTVSIETSGVGMSPARAARLARLLQVEVILGLEGATPTTQDQLSGRSGSFQAAARAARALVKAGLAPQIIFALNRYNSCQMEAAVRLAEDLGASSLRFLASLPNAPAYSLPGQNGNGHKAVAQSAALTVEELIALGRRMERQLIHTTTVRLSFDLPPAFRGLHPLARIEGQGRCEALKQLSLLPGGAYSLCGSAGANGAFPDLIIGQAGQFALGLLWHEHPALQSLRASLPDALDGVCERCIMKTACLGNCAIENYLRSGSFQHAHWFCETADRVGLFPASRLIENRW